MYDDEPAPLSVTVNVMFTEPLSPSVALASAIENFGSSSVIVPVPVAVEMPVPAVALLSVSTTVSLAPSSAVSPATDTVIVLLVSPAANVSVPPATAV